MFNTEHLSDNVETQIVADPAALGTTTVTGGTLDMAGFDAARVIVPITDSAAGSVVTAKAYRDSDSAMGTEEQVAGVATVTCVVDDDINGKLLILDIVRPMVSKTKQYLRFKVTRATANAATGPVIVERYRARKTPVDQHADVSQLTMIHEPDAA